MNVIKHDEQPLERWREGVLTRMRVSAVTGGRQLCVFEQFCDPDLGAPTHLHAVEEVLEVVEGTAEVWLAGEGALVGANQSVLVPAGVPHGFRNAGATVLHVRATLAAPTFEASYQSSTELSRRWVPGAGGPGSSERDSA